MIHIKCLKCNLIYISHLEAEESLTTINTCPHCSRRWLLTKVSGVNYKIYPLLKKTILNYKWK